MSKLKKEDIIRDYLKNKLNLIEEGLLLIDDEHHLKNPDGASGFLDIYANDKKNNLVIIELKRSDAACREAITELSKYAALVRRAKNVKNSEIRLLVISTDWHELRVPFSEYYHATSYQLEGYSLEVDNDLNPIRVKPISPLPQIKGRNICRRHFVRYYKNNQDLEIAENTIVDKARKLGIDDFILAKFKLKFKDEYYGATRVLYWAQQLKSREFYENKLKEVLDNESYEDFLCYIDDFDEDDANDELADRLDDEIQVECETCEIGHPEKLVQRLNDDLWVLDKISKYGLFNEDERLTDDLLLDDLKGLTGASFVFYFASTRTENRSKFDEIISSLDNCLFHNDIWRQNIRDIIEYCRKKDSSSVTISIFNKDDLLETIWGASFDDFRKWVPSFYVIIDPDSDAPVEVFEGEMVWNKKEIDVDGVISDVFGNFKEYLMHRHFGSQRACDEQLMLKMGFSYQVNNIVFQSDNIKKMKNIRIRGKQIVELNDTDTNHFLEFIESEPNTVNNIASKFNRHHIGNGSFLM